nr:PREDICTED: phototropin-2-like [Daucus carota subsp. sativus]
MLLQLKYESFLLYFAFQPSIIFLLFLFPLCRTILLKCRFLQGPDTDQAVVQNIRDAIREQREVTVQLINYSKSGKKFWNLFHLQPMRDQKGELQYFIGVQLDGSDHMEPLRNRLSERSELQSSKLVKATALNINEAVRELPDANLVRLQRTCGLPIPNLCLRNLTTDTVLAG